MWAEILVEGLERAGKDLTRQSFLAAMATIKNFKGASGVPISYSEDNHLGTRALSIMKCTSATDFERVVEMVESISDFAAMKEMTLE
jgi:hypothetical protein